MVLFTVGISNQILNLCVFITLFLSLSIENTSFDRNHCPLKDALAFDWIVQMPLAITNGHL
jgi:hypothetical protein